MTDRLESLTASESRLMAAVDRAVGQMEEKHAELDAAGVYREYRRVHRAYAELAAAGDREALKRALFLQWYAAAEPACLTGLCELDEASERRVLELLEAMVAGGGDGGLDDELGWMLPYCYQHADFFIDRYAGLDALKALCREAREPWRVAIRRETMRGRGQMGRYWRSLR